MEAGLSFDCRWDDVKQFLRAFLQQDLNDLLVASIHRVKKSRDSLIVHLQGIFAIVQQLFYALPVTIIALRHQWRHPVRTLRRWNFCRPLTSFSRMYSQFFNTQFSVFLLVPYFVHRPMSLLTHLGAVVRFGFQVLNAIFALLHLVRYLAAEKAIFQEWFFLRKCIPSGLGGIHSNYFCSNLFLKKNIFH